ncbi:MAG: hypothetical protein IJD53_01495 [Alistipes sp.]|nr:hypothetical protein [Alistipes sp.]
MTNKYANWERLASVIEWANMTTNYFALHIGLTRGENLYHIKRGNYGISHDLADRIVAAFPEIDRTWLLTGVGCMLKSEIQDNVLIPYYPMEAESYLPNFSQYDNKGHAHLPFACNCDIAIRSLSRAMAEPQCAATELFLKRVEVEDMVQGNEYVVITNKDVLWRKIRTVANDDTQWRLVARNREEYDDINIRKDDIKEAWRVIAKMAIMAS